MSESGRLLIKSFFYLTVVFFVLLVFNNLEGEEEFQEKTVDRDLVEKVREGGFVLYLRHGKTDPAQPDHYPLDLEDCSTQRPLTNEGRAEIKSVGEAIRKAGIPVFEVISSPMCRARESAEIAFGPDYRVEVNLMYTAHLTSEQKIPIIERTRELLSCSDIPEGMNRVIVAHAPNLADLLGYFPEREGSLIIFRPLSENGFEYLGTILPEDWDELIEW